MKEKAPPIDERKEEKEEQETLYRIVVGATSCERGKRTTQAKGRQTERERERESIRRRGKSTDG